MMEGVKGEIVASPNERLNVCAKYIYLCWQQLTPFTIAIYSSIFLLF